ncbi:amino acid ABC transporter permease [Suicoccus acidiformans]|uniref:Amino acid ABC transporter permease n=1 Tax=Suicoccus acidiformans TaxID=2036206 RepID=A0A347WK24_9LACT|nr:amino acid ABC transporter permease [Suicoccus acidiformans]
MSIHHKGVLDLTGLTQMNLWEKILWYYDINGVYVWEQFLQHLLLSFYGVILAAIIAVPLGFYLARHHKLAQWIIQLASLIQIVPSIALMTLLMFLFGLGPNLVILTIFLYSLLPILSNTYTGVMNVDQNVINAGKGMGMTRNQVLFNIEIPLSLSIIISGIRSAFVMAIGVATIGAFVGAGGLGMVLIRGMRASDGTAIILAAVIPIALLSIVSDIMLSFVEKRLNPYRA